MSLFVTSSVNTAGSAYKPNAVLKTLSRIGRKIPDCVHDFCDLSSKGSMKRLPCLITLIPFVIGSRYLAARNEDEKREILTRDPLSIISLIYAIPVLRKFASIPVNKITGIPIAQGEKGFLTNLNPEKGICPASFKQLKEWFSVESIKDFNEIKGGFTGFCKNIRDLGGDLIKSFNLIDKNAKDKLKKLAEAVGIKEEITNKNILTLFESAQKSEDKTVKTLLKGLQEMFVGENGLKLRATHLKGVIEFSCIAASAFLLGGLLPWFNIQKIKKLYKNKKQENTEVKVDIQKTSVSSLSMAEKFKEFQSLQNF